MNVKPLIRSAQRFALENSPAILSAVGMIGAITTSVLAARAGYSSAFLLQEAEQDFRFGRRKSLEKRDEFELVWKEFIPPAVIGAITLAAIIGANRIGSRRAAALAAAYTISEKMAEEYRQKVVEHIGAQKEELVRSEVARDRIERTAGMDALIMGEGEIVFYDSWSDRAFSSTKQRVDDVVNQVNYQINQSWAVSLTEFYELLGLKRIEISDDFGWNTDELLDVYFTSCLLPDGRPACEIRYNTKPFQKFNKIGLS